MSAWTDIEAATQAGVGDLVREINEMAARGHAAQQAANDALVQTVRAGPTGRLSRAGQAGPRVLLTSVRNLSGDGRFPPALCHIDGVWGVTLIVTPHNGRM
jgi:hypothetical protein